MLGFFFITDNNSIDFISHTDLRIASSCFLRRKIIIAFSVMQAIVKLNQLFVPSPVPNLQFLTSVI